MFIIECVVLRMFSPVLVVLVVRYTGTGPVISTQALWRENHS